MIAEERGHLRGGLEMAFRVGVQAPAGAVDGAALADAGEQVVEPAALWKVLVHVAGRGQGHAFRFRERGESGEAAGVVAPVAMGGGQIEGCLQPLPVPRQPSGEPGAGHLRRQDDENLLPGRLHDIRAQEPALPFGRAPAPAGDQAGQPSIALPRDRQTEQGRPVHQVEAGTGDEAQVGLPGGMVGAHDARQGVAVGESQGTIAQGMGLLHQFLGVGSAAQKREVAGHLQLGGAARPGRTPPRPGCASASPGFAPPGHGRAPLHPGRAHAKIPCRNQRGGATVPWGRSQ